MADSYDQAQSALEQQRRDYLAAMAQAGSQGAQEFTSAQADIQNQKAQAVQQALAAAAGAPQQLRDQIAQQVGSPYDRRVSDLTSSNASRSSSFGANQAAGDTVIQQAIANIPALRAMSQRQAQAEQFKAQQHAQQDQLSMALKQADMQIKQAELDKAQNGGSSGNPLLDMLHGIDVQKGLNDLNTQKFKTQGGDRSNWANAGPKARSVLELIVGNNDNLGGALHDLYTGQSRGWTDPADKSGKTTLVDLGGTKLDTGALESWLHHYYGS